MSNSIEELTQALEQERRARRAAELRADEAERNRQEFVSLVAHELRVPMTSIKGYTDLLIRGMMGPVPEAQMGFLRVIKSNVERMSAMVTALSDINKIESGRMTLNVTTVSLPEIVQEAVQRVQGKLDEKQQHLTIHVDETLPLVLGDATRLRQILDALFSNAHLYTHQGGHILIQAQTEEETLHVFVQDDGIGIVPEAQAHIFEKFFRAPDEETRQVPGNGLALHLAKLLTNLQQGRIWFESERGQGSTFHLSFPLARSLEETE